MGRAPCCEKMGLKKGPWTAEEDQILINYIQLYGHANWRALPKLAGLLRCGKSCRLRWTNYLRPDIKRGNFSREEEETIIRLHESLGNRWSAIAARLPGRTDNEIKNVWHTHLKKRLNNQQNQNCNPKTAIKTKSSSKQESQETNNHVTDSPMLSQNESSSCGSDATSMGSPEHVPVEMEDNFWSQVLSSADNFCNEVDYDYLSKFQLSSVAFASSEPPEGMEFWYDLFATASAGELTELPEI